MLLPRKIKATLVIGLSILIFAFQPGKTALSGGLGNNPPVITSLTANPNPVPPQGQSELTCIASDSDGEITQYEWTADAGTFQNGTATQIVPAPVNTIVWTAPAESGYSNITVTVYDSGGSFGGPPAIATQYLTILVDGGNNAPIITSLVPESDLVFLGASIFVTASAMDSDGDPLEFQWSASGGTITGDNDSDPEAIIWTAPQSGGDLTITVTVTDGHGGQSAKSVAVTAGIASEGGYIRTLAANPVRITTDDSGQIYVSDTSKDRILVYNEYGDFVREIGGLDAPLGLAAGASGKLYVGEDDSDKVSIYSSSGAFISAFSGPAVEMPNYIDVDSALDKVFVVDSRAAKVLVYNTSGAFQYAIDGSSAIPTGFIFPVGVAVDAATQTIYVTDAGSYQVHGFDYAGNSRINFGVAGRGNGKFTRPQGVAVDTHDHIFAVDSYQSCVQVFNSSGQFVATVGSFGEGLGELSVPLSACVDKFDRLLVTSNDNSRIEVYNLTDGIIPLPNRLPTEPTPSLPAAGAEVTTLNPDLVALPATDPDGDVISYDFEVVEEGQLDAYASVSGVPQAPTQISWTVQPSLRENTFYYWQSRASDGMGVSSWTPARDFFVNAVNDTPSIPPEILILPGVELRPDGALSWAASLDPDAYDIISYTIEIDNDPDFSSILIREENIQANSVTLESLAQYSLLVDDTMYYWRVRAVDNHGAASDWIEGSFYFNRIEIEVASTPPGARVYIDGTPAYPGWRAGPGTTPITVAGVEESLHIVTVIREGSEPYRAIVDNRNGADAQVTATLEPPVSQVLTKPKSYSLKRFVGVGNTVLSRPFAMDWNFDGVADLLLSDDFGIIHLILGGVRPSYAGVLLDTTVVFGISARAACVFAVDWDNDSDFDLLIGTRNEGILLAYNAGDQQTANFISGGKITVQGNDPLPFATWLAPAMIDWNDDGKKDIIVGCSSGLVGLYINSGTDASPAFLDEQFVEADGEMIVVPSGYSAPFVIDYDGDGLSDLLFGSWEGSIYLYKNVGALGAPAFTNAGTIGYYANKTRYLPVNPGPRSTPYFADWDGDGLRELISGNVHGNILFFWGDSPPE